MVIRMTSLLTQLQAKRDEIGTKALAEAMGIKDSAVRMVCTGHYPNPQIVLDKFALKYIDVVPCPYADKNLQRAECRSRSTAPRPFGGAAKLAWWDACQTCKHKGE